MPTPDIDFDELSAAETKTIAKKALAELSIADVIEVINEAVDGDSMEELVSQLSAK